MSIISLADFRDKSPSTADFPWFSQAAQAVVPSPGEGNEGNEVAPFWSKKAKSMVFSC